MAKEVLVNAKTVKQLTGFSNNDLRNFRKANPYLWKEVSNRKILYKISEFPNCLLKNNNIIPV
jgi:hypothetical protein